MLWNELPIFNSPSLGVPLIIDQEERKRGIRIWPLRQHILDAFAFCKLDDLKVVILGQDPYPTACNATGLAFDPGGVTMPPSLLNIMKELKDDIGVIHAERPRMLMPWAEQGVLLLNTALTVEEGKPGSHAERWESFTQGVIETIIEETMNVVFLAWGRHAQNTIDPFFNKKFSKRHAVFASAHPSPLSAHKGFFGSRPFSHANLALSLFGKQSIIW